MVSGFQPLTISERKLHLRCLTDSWMHILIQLWCCVFICIIIQFSFIYFFILSFRCFMMINRFNCLKCVFVRYHFGSFLVSCNFAPYFAQFFLYLVSFFSYPFVRCCLAQSSLCTYFTGRFIVCFMCNYWLLIIQCYFIVFAIISMTNIEYQMTKIRISPQVVVNSLVLLHCMCLKYFTFTCFNINLKTLTCYFIGKKYHCWVSQPVRWNINIRKVTLW